MVCPVEHNRPGPPAKLEVADVFRTYGGRLPELSRHQARTVQAITSCRTAALGGHIQECDRCRYRRISYNSCRNRHCPKCQGLDEVRWVERQQEALLPIEYHHVVFTVPDVLHPLLRGNPRVGYTLLFASVAETLQEVAQRPKNLGARIGFTSVLHTWSQTLQFHPHIHCIVSGGGLSPDHQRWVSAKPRFLFALEVLRRVYRGKLLSKLEHALDTGKLRCSSTADGHEALRRAARKGWVVYSKPPFAGPEQVLRYLGRYAHRIAISNSRLLSMNDGKVSFRWRDRRNDNQAKVMTLDATEFLRRYLQHILPPGFMRIRHYGLLASACRTQLDACRKLLGVRPADDGKRAESWHELLLRVTGEDVTLCPECRAGHFHTVDRLEPHRSRARPPPPKARSP